jgi:ribonucleoside-diphosphate reductase alpha chain
MSYDQDKVTRRVDAVEGVRRLSGVPDEGDDPLVKATAVWDGVGEAVEVVHGGPVDPVRGPLVGPGSTIRDDNGRRSPVPDTYPAPSHEPDNTLEATGETCGECGGLMRRTGACMTCESCGTNTGCG